MTDPTEHQNAVLQGEYALAFYRHALKERLCSFDHGDWSVNTYPYREYRNRRILTAALEAFLVYDKAILVGHGDVNADELESLGHVERVSELDEPALLGALPEDSATKAFLATLKPFITTAAAEMGFGKSALSRHKFSPEHFYNVLFEAVVIEDERAPSTEIEAVFLDMAKDFRQGMIDKGADSESISDLMAASPPVTILSQLAGEILTLVDLSNSRNAAVFQTDYPLLATREDIHGLQRANEAGEASSDTYVLLRAAVQDQIGSLPEVTSIRHAVRLKEKYRKELSSLREALAELEHTIKNGNSSALAQATRLVRSASRDLRRAGRMRAVTKWVKVFTAPVAAVERHLYGGSYGGIALGVCSQAVALAASRLEGKSGWLQVFR